LAPVSEAEKSRLVAWAGELREAHARLRALLHEARAGHVARADLLLYCQGFCTALTDHHEAEDASLFPVLAAEHPALIAKLREDHDLIAMLLAELARAPEGDLQQHLDGIGAIMESHFRFEERDLLPLLAG
jgi:hemerythrin superfamily protein